MLSFAYTYMLQSVLQDSIGPGAIARSEASSLGMQAAPSSILTSGILSWRLGHENISTAILPLPLIQEEQLSVTGERVCTKYW